MLTVLRKIYTFLEIIILAWLLWSSGPEPPQERPDLRPSRVPTVQEKCRIVEQYRQTVLDGRFDAAAKYVAPEDREEFRQIARTSQQLLKMLSDKIVSRPDGSIVILDESLGDESLGINISFKLVQIDGDWFIHL
jgi:hypothetical protein